MFSQVTSMFMRAFLPRTLPGTCKDWKAHFWALPCLMRKMSPLIVRRIRASHPNLGDLDEDNEYPAEPLSDLSSMPSPVALQIAGVLGGTLAVGAAAVAAERWLFSRGERRLSNAISYAHTRQAVALSTLTAALCALDFTVQYFFDSELGE